jgi:hypothetical protein
MARFDDAPPTESTWEMYDQLLTSMHDRLKELPREQSANAYQRAERVGFWVDELFRRHGEMPNPGQWLRLLAIVDADLAGASLTILRDHGTAVTEGVYAAMSGPAYETPAETEMLRRMGATVVGMSTVPEAVVARALGMRVLGLSFVTNAAGGAVSHEEVLLASKTAAEAIGRVVAGLADAF